MALKSKAETDNAQSPQIGVRLDPDMLARLEAVATKLSRPGLSVTRSDAARICLIAGLLSIEKDK